MPHPTKERIDELIEQQCDFYACGTQDRRFLRTHAGHETQEREMIRLNLEQFARFLLKEAAQ